MLQSVRQSCQCVNDWRWEEVQKQLFKGQGVYFQLEANCPSLHLSVLLSALLHSLTGGSVFYDVPVTSRYLYGSELSEVSGCRGPHNVFMVRVTWCRNIIRRWLRRFRM